MSDYDPLKDIDNVIARHNQAIMVWARTQNELDKLARYAWEETPAGSDVARLQRTANHFYKISGFWRHRRNELLGWPTNDPPDSYYETLAECESVP